MEQAPEIGDRMIDKAGHPDEKQVRAWMGRGAYGHWSRLRRWIDASYPGVFAPDWLYGGKARGWALRYTRTKALCTLIPAYRKFYVLIVLGGPEREKFEARVYSWSPQLVKLYDETRTFHDGKWLAIPISSLGELHEITDLVSMKRPPPALDRRH